MTIKTQNDLLVKLSEDTLTLSDPAQDIRGRNVIDRHGDAIGHVSDLFIDKNERKVRLLQVSAGGFLGLGDRHFLVPVDAVARVSQAEVHIDQTRDKVAKSPAYDPKLSEVPLHNWWAGYYGYYGYSPYGSPAYLNPVFPGVY